MLKIIGRCSGDPDGGQQGGGRADAIPGPEMSLEFCSGAVGTAKVQVFTSVDDEDRGGVVFKFEIIDQGSAFIPFAENIANGVELHFAGDAEAASLINALKGVLAALPNPERYKSNTF